MANGDLHYGADDDRLDMNVVIEDTEAELLDSNILSPRLGQHATAFQLFTDSVHDFHRWSQTCANIVSQRRCFGADLDKFN